VWPSLGEDEEPTRPTEPVSPAVPISPAAQGSPGGPPKPGAVPTDGAKTGEPDEPPTDPVVVEAEIYRPPPALWASAPDVPWPPGPSQRPPADDEHDTTQRVPSSADWTGQPTADDDPTLPHQK
jgi:hypothetical protein